MELKPGDRFRVKIGTVLEAMFDSLEIGRLNWMLARPTLAAMPSRPHTRETCDARKKSMPSFDDTYFTVLLPALALLSLSVIGPTAKDSAADRDSRGPTSFRAWLARLIHRHLEQG